MIESRSQAGHRRNMTSAQPAAQSVSSLYGGAESGINRIVAHWSSAPPALTCQDLSRKRSSFLLKQKSNWKRITLLACSFYGCDSEYWPVIPTIRELPVRQERPV